MLNDFLNSSYVWLVGNGRSFVVLIIGVAVTYVIYRILSREITKLKNQEKMDENIAYNLNQIIKWVSVLAVLGIVVTQFVVDLTPVFGFMALAGGTIIGFASMNTIGNAIAGIIVVISKPFKIGDRILFNDEFADIVAIDVIYTRMKTLDNVLISIPNQQLLTTKIDNYGKKNIVRRKCSITVGYEENSEKIEKVLLEAAIRAEGVLKEPKSYVLITNLLNFSVEYTLYVFISQIKRLPVIESNLKRAVLDMYGKNGIDLTTPNLVQSVGGKNTPIYSE